VLDATAIERLQREMEQELLRLYKKAAAGL
jgi:hypothetical protein